MATLRADYRRTARTVYTTDGRHNTSNNDWGPLYTPCTGSSRWVFRVRTSNGPPPPPPPSPVISEWAICRPRRQGAALHRRVTPTCYDREPADKRVQYATSLHYILMYMVVKYCKRLNGISEKSPKKIACEWMESRSLAAVLGISGRRDRAGEPTPTGGGRETVRYFRNSFVFGNCRLSSGRTFSYVYRHGIGFDEMLIARRTFPRAS